MKKMKRMPTVLGLLILIGGLVTGLILIRQKNVWQSQASSNVTPQQIRITNITDTGFTVSWITESQTSGFVKYGRENSRLDLTALDERDQLSGKTGKFLTHHVVIKNLAPGINCFFKIGSSDNLYQQITARSPQGNPPTNDVAYGSVLDQNKNPVEGAIIYLSLNNTVLQSTITKSSGNWVIPLNLAYVTDLAGYSLYDRQASVEEIFVQGGTKGTATAVTITQKDSPVPPLILGQSFDFRTQTTAQGEDEPSSGFGLPETTSTPNPSDLIIINPKEGEKIPNLMPEIFGSGPAGETVTITLQSTNQYSGSVKIDALGNWKWTPPESLEPGEHMIGVLLASGKRVSRLFTVMAAGETDLPSFTATPSASLTPTFTPTPTATPPVRTSMPSTQSGVPSSGYLTPTFFVSIMGLVLIVLGIFTKIRII